MAEYISYLEKIKSKYIIKKIFNNMQEKNILQILKYNKNIQKKNDININSYIKYSQIEVEIITNGSGKLINIKNNEKKFYHIYEDNTNIEMNINYIDKKDINKKIIILIDHNINSLDGLFEECRCIESINFKKFNRNNIYSMKNMFASCSLKSIILSNFKTNKVSNMSHMFYGCDKLNKLKLSSLNTENVISMDSMFENCYNLNELNISNFNTKNVKSMSGMFY